MSKGGRMTKIDSLAEILFGALMANDEKKKNQILKINKENAVAREALQKDLETCKPEIRGYIKGRVPELFPKDLQN